MKSAKARDEMVKRASAALKKWPTFASLPESKKMLPKHVKVKGHTDDVISYVEAMHEMCVDATPVGRHLDEIVGE